jgi:hypothetical protein
MMMTTMTTMTMMADDLTYVCQSMMVLRRSSQHMCAYIHVCFMH